MSPQWRISANWGLVELVADFSNTGRIAQLVEQRTENPKMKFLLSFAFWHYH
jgi:hypothetical protein